MKTEEIAKQALAQLRHQLRTPLNHIIGYSEILLEDAAEAHRSTRLADERSCPKPASCSTSFSSISALRRDR